MKYRKIIVIFVIILAIILISLTGTSYAKYVSNNVWNYYIKSKGFYFSSDDLGNNVINRNNMWDGTNVYFNLRNSANNYLVTGYDIKYNISCEVIDNPNLTCVINDQGSSFNGTLSSYSQCINMSNDKIDVSSYDKSTCEISGYDWKHVLSNKNNYFNVISNDDSEFFDATVKIIATSTSPYTKTLTGKYILHKVISNDELIYDYSDYGDYGVLTITNPNIFSKDVLIKWNTELIVIDSDEELESSISKDNYINSVSLNLDSKSSKSYMFYEKVNDDYTDKDFQFITE